MKSRMLHLDPQVAFTWSAFFSWFCGFVTIQQRTRTFCAIFLASTSFPRWTKKQFTINWSKRICNTIPNITFQSTEKTIAICVGLRFNTGPVHCSLFSCKGTIAVILGLGYSTYIFHKKLGTHTFIQNNKFPLPTPNSPISLFPLDWVWDLFTALLCCRQTKLAFDFFFFNLIKTYGDWKSVFNRSVEASYLGFGSWWIIRSRRRGICSLQNCKIWSTDFAANCDTWQFLYSLVFRANMKFRSSSASS